MSIKILLKQRSEKQKQRLKNTRNANLCQQDMSDMNSSSKIPRFQQFYEGKMTNQVYKRYILIVYMILFYALAQAIVLYPEIYSMFTEYISNLGDLRFNPSGYPVFNIGMVIVGLSLIPIINFSFSEKKKQICNLPQIDNEKKALFAADLSKMEDVAHVLSVIACIGLIIAGIFPSNIEYPHLIGAILLFLGFYLSNNLQFFAKSERLKIYTLELNTKPSLKINILISIGFNIIALTFLTILLNQINFIEIPNIGEKYTSSTFWEWIFFIVCNIMVFYWFFHSFRPSSKKDIPKPNLTQSNKGFNPNSDNKYDHSKNDYDFSHDNSYNFLNPFDNLKIPI